MSPGVFLRPADSLHVWNGKKASSEAYKDNT